MLALRQERVDNMRVNKIQAQFHANGARWNDEDVPRVTRSGPRSSCVGHTTGTRAKAWCLHIHAEASLSHLHCPTEEPAAAASRSSLSRGSTRRVTLPNARGLLSFTFSST